MDIKNGMKNLFFRNDFAYRNFDWLMQFYVVNLRDKVTDARTLFNYYAMSKRDLSSKGEFPKYLYINPTNYCNAKCTFCAYRKLNDKFETMGMDLFRKIIDEFASLGGHSVSLTPTVGEIFVDPTIYEKIAYCKSNGLFVSIVSNGLLLNMNENWKKISASGVDELFISTGDIAPHYDAQVYGVHETLSKARIDGFLKLAQEKEQTGAKFNLVMAMRPQRRCYQILDDLKQSPLWDYYQRKVFKIEWLHGYDNWGGMITQAELIGVQKLRSGAALKKYPCSNLFQLSILASGHVRLCGCRLKNTAYDELVIGNLKEKSLSQIWESEERKKVVHDFVSGRLPEVCKGCSFYGPRIK